MSKSKTSMQHPLGRAKGLGSAHDGTKHFWAQRVTAICLIPLLLWLVGSLLSLSTAGYSTVIDWIGRPFNAIVLCLSLGALFYHAALGLQVVIEDYIHHHGLKLFKLIISNAACLILAVVGIFAVLKIAL